MKPKSEDSIIKFKNYYVDSVKYRTNYDFETSTDGVTIDFDVKREIAEVDENIFAVSLLVNIFDEPEKNNFPFTMDLKVTGIFEFKDYNDEYYEILEQNTIAILFPYVRSLVSSYTANTNLEPLILPIVNVIKMIENADSE